MHVGQVLVNNDAYLISFCPVWGADCTYGLMCEFVTLTTKADIQQGGPKFV